MVEFAYITDDFGNKHFELRSPMPEIFKRRYDTFQNLFSIQNIKFDSKQHYDTPVPKNKRTCIFCGLGAPNTTFKKDAHLISQCLGNKKLLSYRECDECNEFFGRYENDITQYLGHRRLQPNSNKNFRARGAKFVLNKTGTGGLNITNIQGHIHLVADSFDELPKIQIKSLPYSPLNIWKLMAKMALSCMEDNDLAKYSGLIRFLFDDCRYMHDTHYKEIYTVYRTNVRQWPGSSVGVLFKKRDRTTRTFTHSFQLSFFDEVWQIFLPMNDDDDILYDGINPIGFHYCPPLFLSEEHIEVCKANNQLPSVNHFYANRKAKTTHINEVKISAEVLINSDKFSLNIIDKELGGNVYTLKRYTLAKKDPSNLNDAVSP